MKSSFETGSSELVRVWQEAREAFGRAAERIVELLRATP